MCMKERKNLAIIPARGGSKRIPDKNIRDFLGKPIISYAIKTALESRLFDITMVSTDSQEIADISRSFGAQIPFLRSAENADDHATLSDVIEEVKAAYAKENKFFDNICCILPTSPLLQAENLKAGLELLVSGGFSSVRPVIAFSYPPQRAFRLKNKRVEFLHPEYTKTRSQDLEKHYHDAGQFYWMKAESGLSGDNRGAFEISELDAQDIDTLEDWKMAELKYKLQNKI